MLCTLGESSNGVEKRECGLHSGSLIASISIRKLFGFPDHHVADDDDFLCFSTRQSEEEGGFKSSRLWLEQLTT